MADLGVLPRLVACGVSDEHAETRLEGCDIDAYVVWGDVVDSDAPVSAETEVRKLTHALVRAVAGSEVQDGGPVVGQVFGEGAASACRLLDEIVRCRVHGRVERVAPDDLVEMRRGDRAGAHERIETFDD